MNSEYRLLYINILRFRDKIRSCAVKLVFSCGPFNFQSITLSDMTFKKL